MAEVLGVMATAYTLFQQCQTAFTVFTTAKSFREDGDTMRCMLEWEEYRFRRWGEASGLPSWDQVDSASELPNGTPTGGKGLNWALISNTLRVLHNLLQDTEKLKTRYRLELSDDDGKSIGNDSEASSTRMRKLFRLPERTPTITQVDRPKVGLVKRMSWALEDKDQVQKLVGDIGGLNDHLMALLDVTWQMSIQKSLATLVEEAETRVETAEDRAILRKAMEDSLRDQKEAAEERRQNLFSAIYQGNLDEVKVLFAVGASHDYRWNTHTSPFGRAVEHKQLAIAQFLLENGANVNKDEYMRAGMTPFLVVAEDGSPDMLFLLLEHGADKTAVDGHGRNAVRIAAEKNNIAVLRELLKDPFFRDKDCVDEDCITPFQAAARAGNQEVLELLFEHYPNDLNRAEKNEYFVPPLILAVANEHANATKFLLSCPGVEVNITSHAGSSALTAAASAGDLRDANPEMLDTLRKAGANVKHQDNKGYNALAQAVVSFNPEIVAHLLTWDDMDINAMSVAGSPLCIAAQRGRKDMVQMLLDKKPDLDVRDDRGKTALALAAGGPSDFDKWYDRNRLEDEQSYKIICRKLLKAGLPIDAADSKDRTPLVIAAESGHALIVEFLLEQGADINAEDEDGETALDFAKQKKHSHVLQVLEGHVRKTWICSKCKSEEKR
ncbi:hypothetical protein MMC30_007433 [Trapelia coarctata]|nr:hypothetical protein [Trapelia coarctata]